MSPIGFLLIAVGVAVVGSLVVVLRNRQAKTPEHAMDEFKREMQALAPADESLVDQGDQNRFPFRPGAVDE